MNKKIAILFNIALVLTLAGCGTVKTDDEKIDEKPKNEIIEGEKDNVSLVKKYYSGSTVLQKDFGPYILETRIDVSSNGKINGVDFTKLVKYNFYQDSLGNLYLMLEGKEDKDGVVIIPKSYRKLDLTTTNITLPTVLDALKLDDLVSGKDDERIKGLKEVTIYLASDQLAEYSLYESQMKLLEKRIVEDQNTYGIILEDGHASNIHNLVINISEEVSLAEEILNEIKFKEDETNEVYGIYQKGSYELYSPLYYHDGKYINYHLHLLVDEYGKITTFTIKTINGEDSFDLEKLANLVKLNGSLLALDYRDSKDRPLTLDKVLLKEDQEYKHLAYLDGFREPVNFYIELVNSLLKDVKFIPFNDGTYRVNTNDSYLTVTITNGKITNILYDKFNLEDSRILNDGVEYPLYHFTKTYLDSSLEEQSDLIYVYLKNDKYYYAKDYLDYRFKKDDLAKISDEEKETLVLGQAPTKVTKDFDVKKIYELNNPYVLNILDNDTLEFSNLLASALRTSLDRSKDITSSLVSENLSTIKKFASSNFTSVSPFLTDKGYPYLSISFKGNKANLNIDYLNVVNGNILFSDTYDKVDEKSGIESSSEFLKKNLELDLATLNKYDYKKNSELKESVLSTNSDLYDDFSYLFDEVFLRALEGRVYEVRDEAIKTLEKAFDYKDKKYLVNLEDKDLNEKLAYEVTLRNEVASGIKLDFRLSSSNDDIRIEEVKALDGQKFKIYAKTSLTGYGINDLKLEVKFKSYDDLDSTISFISCDLASFASAMLDDFNTFSKNNSLISTKEDKNSFEIYLSSEKDILLDKDNLFDIIIDSLEGLDDEAKNKLREVTKDYVSQYVILDYEAKNKLREVTKDYVSQYVILDYEASKEYLVDDNGVYVFERRKENDEFKYTKFNSGKLVEVESRDELYINPSDLDQTSSYQTVIRLKPNKGKEAYEIKLRLYLDTMHVDDVLELYGTKFKGTWQVGEPYVDLTLRVLPSNMVKEKVNETLNLSNIMTAYKDTYYKLINLDDLRINGIDIKYYGTYSEQNSGIKYDFNYLNNISYQEFMAFFDILRNGNSKDYITSYDLTYLNEKSEFKVEKINLLPDDNNHALKVIGTFNYYDKNDLLTKALIVLEKRVDPTKSKSDGTEANDNLQVNFYKVSGESASPISKDDAKLKLTTKEVVELPSMYRMFDKLKKTVETVNRADPTKTIIRYEYTNREASELYKMMESNLKELALFMAHMPFVIDGDKLVVSTAEDKVYDAKMLVKVEDSDGKELVTKEVSLDTVTSSKNKLVLALENDLESVDLLKQDKVNGIPLVVKYSDLKNEKDRTFKDIFSILDSEDKHIIIRNDLGYTLDLNSKLYDEVMDQVRPDKKKGDSEEIMFTVNAYYKDSEKNVIEAKVEISFKLLIDAEWHD